jgi:hypothetical protein
MISRSDFPHRLTEIDDLTRSDHSFLTANDRCYFLGEYTARKRYTFSATNDLILNFKIGVEHRGSARWRYKEQAIRKAAAAFAAAISPEALAETTLVPIPPSRARDHPEYDDRVVRMLRAIRPQPPLDVRELILQRGTTAAAHQSDVRLRPKELVELYELDLHQLQPPPVRIAIFDDVLTTGAHYVAARTILAAEFPSAEILGCFIARRVPETTDFAVFLN